MAALVGLALLAGCSSPADVEKRHREVLETYHADMAYAQEWNNHVLGIPASGWVAILLFGSLLLAGLSLAAGMWAYQVLERRARHRQQLAAKQLDLQIAREKRGRCTVCGADPLVDKPAKGA